MSTVEDRLREALAERAARSPIDPDAWDKTVAQSRHRLLPWRWSGWAVRLAPAAAVVAAIAVVISATLLGTEVGQGASPAGPSSANPSASPNASPSQPAGLTSTVRQIPPVTPFVSISLRVDGEPDAGFPVVRLRARTPSGRDRALPVLSPRTVSTPVDPAAPSGAFRRGHWPGRSRPMARPGSMWAWSSPRPPR